MSLFTSSSEEPSSYRHPHETGGRGWGPIAAETSRKRHMAWPLLVFLGVNLIICLVVVAIPWKGAGYFQDLCINEIKEEPRDILLMGDSKVFPFVDGYTNCPFFEKPAYALAMDSATVLYQRILYNRIIAETDCRPKVVFYSTGANNFNENGLHVLRDYAIRFVATGKDLFGYWVVPGSLPYLVDAFFSRIYPVYGRRIEITHLMFRGYKPRTIDLSEPERDPVADENYLLIYKRGVLTDYSVSEFHLENLKLWAEEIERNGGQLVVLDLPVTEEMRELELEVCGEWDRKIEEASNQAGFKYIDLREHSDLPFRDINHLSNLGAETVVERWLQPLADEIVMR